MLIYIIYLTIMVLSNGAQCNIVLMPEAMYSYTSPTANIDKYILQHQRQFEEQIRALEKYLEDFHKEFKLRLEVLQYYNSVVDIKLRDLKDKLEPLEVLGGFNYVCVKKYREKIPNANILKVSLNTCINKATTTLSSIINNPENTIKNIRHHYNNHFINVIKDCKNKFQKDETKYKVCATTAIKSSNTYFNTNANTFHTQMSVAECSSNTKIREAFDCYSPNIYQAFTAIGEVNALVENCLAGHDFCAACEFADSDIIKGLCPYHMAWNLADNDLTADKIVNPFKRINDTTPCLQVNFITKTFVNSVDKE